MMRKGSVRVVRGARTMRVVAAVGVLALVLGACEAVVTQRVNQARVAAGRPELPVSSVLTEAARAHSRAMCAAGAVTPSPNAGGEYDQETQGGVYELVGAAPLRPEVAASSRNGDATNTIWDAWKNNPQLTAARWDDMGVGEVECADGKLYMTAVLRDAPSMLASGLYSTPQYDVSQLTQITGIQYGTAVNEQGQHQALTLDLFVPPALNPPTARPTILLVHGGSFVGGSSSDLAGEARTWAVRGFVAASINYRLASVETVGGAGLLVAASNAIDDAMESVRWLKANAATYGIDPLRIGTVGFSAGGAISIGLAVADDITPTGPLAAYPPTVAAAISTGAHLTPGIEAGVLTFQETDAPIMMFHFDTDTATGDSAAYAFQTCAAVRTAGSTCDFIQQPGSGHTAWLAPGGAWWSNKIGPFIWRWLRGPLR
jgi:acetyl esterase/lipase